MKTTELKAFKRKELGKKSTKDLRKQGMVPSVLYGGKDNVHFYVNRIDFDKLIYTPDIFLITLDVEGTKYQAIIQALQFHPVTDVVIHADLLQVSDNKPITIGVPVKTEGLAKGVRSGGTLTIHQRKLLVKGLAKNIPNEIVIDVTNLELAKQLQIGDLNYPDLEFLNPKSSVVVSVRMSRLALLADEEEADEEDEEGTEEGGEDSAEETPEETAEN